VKEMSIKTFTDIEVEILSKNGNVKKASKKGITYTDEFKRKFIAENETGKFPKDIFESEGFDINIIGKQRIKSCGNRWRRLYRENSILGLSDKRKENSGRYNENELCIEKKYKLLEAQINLLKAENYLLKKLELAERRMIKKK
jgi:transposase